MYRSSLRHRSLLLLRSSAHNPSTPPLRPFDSSFATLPEPSPSSHRFTASPATACSRDRALWPFLPSYAPGICIARRKPLVVARCFSTTDTFPHVVIEMPALSPTMNHGNLSKWRKKEGDKINTGDVLCEIETDKAVLEFESLEEGFLAKILVPEGSKDVPVGQPIAITVEDPEEIKNVPAMAFGGIDKEKASSQEVEETSQNTEHKGISQKGNVNRVSPVAKLLISEYGLDLSSLKASGPRGTLTKGDVLEVIKSGRIHSKHPSLSTEKPTSLIQHTAPTSPLAPGTSLNQMGTDKYDDVPNSQIRKVIAKRLVESKQNTPHFYLSSDVILDPLLDFRNMLKEQHNLKVSINDIIIKAVAISLRSVPKANAFWNEKDGEVSLCGSIDLSVAVATEKGLMTPIVRNADQKTLSSISSEVKELAEKARAGKLTPDQYQGGTFSISNLGMFPVDRFCAIINPPQACILAVGRGVKVVEPMVKDDGVEKPTAVTKMSLNLSADHRVYDSEIGGVFLSTLSANLNNVRRLLL